LSISSRMSVGRDIPRSTLTGRRQTRQFSKSWQMDGKGLKSWARAVS
jgi:hypothetical protein